MVHKRIVIGMVAALAALGVALPVSRPVAIAPAAAADEIVSDSTSDPTGRFIDRTALWQPVGGDLLSGFLNMYNLHIVIEPEDAAYPCKGWFFGWTTATCNPGYPGCDATYAARAPALAGPWEVYCGDDPQGAPIWDATGTPARWVPVIAGGTTNFNNWHNGDPSVVRQADGRYVMAYSATGHNADGIPWGQPGDTDSDISCIFGATSPDGLHWTVLPAPILIDPDNIGQPPAEKGGYLHPEGLYHRPSLLREDGVWKIWFDAFIEGGSMVMLYAENHGDFADPAQWRIVRGLDHPVMANWPNPDVVKVEDVYFLYGDPGGYPGVGWATRQTAEAVSLDGVNWLILGYLQADAGRQANHVPEATVAQEGGKTWIYLDYGSQIPGDYQYDRIRMKRREVTELELARWRAALARSGVQGWTGFLAGQSPARSRNQYKIDF